MYIPFVYSHERSKVVIAIELSVPMFTVSVYE